MIVSSLKAPRRGTVLPLLLLLTVFLVAMVAFVVDLGYIAVTRSELQNGADAAALAGAMQLRGTEGQQKWYDNRGGEQALIKYYEGDNPIRREAQRFGQANQAGGANAVIDLNVGNDPRGDIVLGYTPKDSAAASLQYEAAPYNTVKVTAYRNPAHAGSLSLFFGPVIGIDRADVTAAATARYTDAPWNVLPIALLADDFARLLDSGRDPGETDSYTYDPNRAPDSASDSTNRVLGSSNAPQPDGIPELKLYPEKVAPGNYGTVDLGSLSGSASDLERQIYTGLSVADRSAMQLQGLLTNGAFVATPRAPVQVSGDTGVSWGIKDALTSIRGQTRTIPLYSKVEANGTKATFTIVGFANVIIVEVSAGNDKEVRIQPVAPYRIFHTTSANMLGSVTLVR